MFIELKYGAVMRWLQEVTESSKCRSQGCDCSPVGCRAAVSARPSPQQNDQGHGPVCNAEVPAGVSAASFLDE